MGLPVLAAFLAVVLVFEIRKAIKAFKEKKRFELGMAVVFAVVAGLALFVLFYF